MAMCEYPAKSRNSCSPYPKARTQTSGPLHRVTREVNDREAAEAQAQTPFVEQFRARVVRPAVRHLVAHTLDRRALDAPRRRTVLPDSADAAHESASHSPT